MGKRLLDDVEVKVYQQLLPTWQPVAAIAMRCEVPVKTALASLLSMETRGIVKKVRARLDGHNRVHCFKKLEYVQILGVYTVVEKEEDGELC